jgi:hypothetical protein
MVYAGLRNDHPSLTSSFAALFVAPAVLGSSDSRANGEASTAAGRASSLKIECVGRLAYGQASSHLSRAALNWLLTRRPNLAKARFWRWSIPKRKRSSGCSTTRSPPTDHCASRTATRRRSAGPEYPAPPVRFSARRPSDGDVFALSIERAPEGAADRTFVLFAAASARLYRGTCATRSD